MTTKLEEQINVALKLLPKDKPKHFIVRPARPKQAGGKKRHGALRLKWHRTTTKTFYKRPEFRSWHQMPYEMNVVAYAHDPAGNVYVIYRDHNRQYDGKVHGPDGITIHHWGPLSSEHRAKEISEANASTLWDTGGVWLGGKSRRGGFAKLERKLKKRGAHDPEALAAWIGRKVYGKQKFQKMALKGRMGGKRRHGMGFIPRDLKRLAQQSSYEEFMAFMERNPTEAAYAREKSGTPGNYFLSAQPGRKRELAAARRRQGVEG